MSVEGAGAPGSAIPLSVPDRPVVGGVDAPAPKHPGPNPSRRDSTQFAGTGDGTLRRPRRSIRSTRCHYSGLAEGWPSRARSEADPPSDPRSIVSSTLLLCRPPQGVKDLAVAMGRTGTEYPRMPAQAHRHAAASCAVVAGHRVPYLCSRAAWEERPISPGEQAQLATHRHQTFILLLHTRVFCAKRVAIMPLILFPPPRV